MSGAGTNKRRTKRVGTWVALLSLLMSTLGITLASVISNGANALAGSTFNGADGIPDTVGVTVVPDATGGADLTNYTGPKNSDDDVCPTVATGTAPHKDDLDKMYFGTESNAAGVFIYHGWHRVDTS